MSKLGTIKFKGESGNIYEFDIYEFDTDFKDGVKAVYCVTRRKAKNTGGYNHTILYVGQTDDIAKRFENHHKADCFKENNANCICLYLEDDKDNRLVIEADLIKNYDPTCND